MLHAERPACVSNTTLLSGAYTGAHDMRNNVCVGGEVGLAKARALMCSRCFLAPP